MFGKNRQHNYVAQQLAAKEAKEAEASRKSLELKEARSRFELEAGAAFKNFVSEKAAFRIVDKPGNYFVIEKLEVQSAFNELRWYGNYYTAKDFDEMSRQPYESYSRLENASFKTFEEAELYLFKYAQPENYTVEYDYPPLVKRNAPTST